MNSNDVQLLLYIDNLKLTHISSTLGNSLGFDMQVCKQRKQPWDCFLLL